MSEQIKTHTMWVSFQGDPGLEDINSPFQLSLSQLRGVLSRNLIFATSASFAERPHDPPNCLRIEFSCRAGLDMPYRFQKFTSDLIARTRQIAPHHPVSQILFSQGFPASKTP